MNTPVNFEISKLLKEKEYKDKNMLGTVRLSEPEYYDPNGIIHNIKDIFEEKDYEIEDCFNAPTIVEVIMWLYEKHGIWIYPYPVQPFVTDDEDYPKIVWVVKCLSMKQIMFEKFIDADNGLAINHHPSPIEAYEEAIKYTLNNLI